MLPTSGDISGKGAEPERLRVLANEGLNQRVEAMGLLKPETLTYKERLDFELETIIKMGFSGYFLIVRNLFVGPKIQTFRLDPAAVLGQVRWLHGR